MSKQDPREDLYILEGDLRESNTIANEVVSIIRNEAYKNGVVSLKFSINRDINELQIYDYIITLFSVKLSIEDKSKLNQFSMREYVMVDELGFVLRRHFYKSLLSTFLLKRVAELDKNSKKIILEIFVKFLNLDTKDVNLGLYKTYILNQREHTFETSTDSLKALRTFLIFLDTELSEALKVKKMKRKDNYFGLQLFIKETISVIPQGEEIDTNNLPNTFIDLIKTYNPEFGSLFPQEAIEG